MLYELARKYDEWPGEGYEGSSARGAMKGWVRHGVASRLRWPDDHFTTKYFDAAVADEAMGVPGGAFYLWAPAPDGDAWAFAERLAVEGGCLVSPGDLYGDAGGGHVRVAVVQPADRLKMVGERLAAAR